MVGPWPQVATIQRKSDRLPNMDNFLQYAYHRMHTKVPHLDMFLVVYEDDKQYTVWNSDKGCITSDASDTDIQKYF